MSAERFTRTGRLIRNGAAAAAAALVAAMLAGGGAAAATAHWHNTGMAHASPAAAGTISTVAGGAGGPTKAANIGIAPGGLAFGGGRMYVTDLGAVRAINPRNDRLATPAGTRADGPLGEGGPAAGAGLSKFVSGVAVDHAHNLVIADAANNRIRVVASRTGTFYGQAMTAGHIYTVAGNGTGGGAGDGGPATSAELSNPAGVAVGAHGSLVIADTDNHEVRLVAASTGTFFGHHMTAGNIYTIAAPPQVVTSVFTPGGVAVDAAGNAVVTDYGQCHLWVVAARTGTFYGQAMKAGHSYAVAGNGTTGFSGDGGPALDAAIADPRGVAVDAAGNLVFADGANNRIRVVAASTGTFYGRSMTAGDIYTIAGTGARGYSGNRGPATSARIYAPDGVTFDRAGNLVFADSGNNRVRVVAAGTGTFYGIAMTAGDIYTIAGNGHRFYSGDGGPATNAELSTPNGVAADAAGNVLIADRDNDRVRVAAASTGTFYGRSMTAGHIYTVAGTGTSGYSGDGGPAAQAEVRLPAGVAVDAHGNLLIADLDNQRIRVVADSTGSFYGIAMTTGDIYTIAGNGKRGFSCDGGPATSAELFAPNGVAVDGAGNVLIADTQNSRVRVVAESTGTFYGQAMTAGDIYTIAGSSTSGYSGDGGPATSAKLTGPAMVAVDAAGNVLIADYGNNRIRVVAASTGTFYGIAMTAGDIYTIAGQGTAGFGGDGGPATSAKFNGPQSVAVDAAGNILIADTYNHRIRMVAASTSTFYGQAVTAGHIYTIAGNGGGGTLGGFSGDGGPATGAELSFPSGVAATAAGNVLIADLSNNRIRMVTG
jgi:trimeric autotransporter adhesin